MSKLLCLAALFSLCASDPLRYRPAEGLGVERRLSGDFELRLRDWNVQMNGREVPSQYLPELEIEIGVHSRLLALDELREAREGRPVKLRREYSELACRRDTAVAVNGAEGGSSGAVDAKPSLPPCAIVFQAADGDAQGLRRPESGEIDSAVLEALELDLDFTALLPVGDDERWDAELSALNPFDPKLAGVSFRFADDEDDIGAPAEQLLANATGMWRLERAGERDENGLALCVVKLEGDFKTHGERRTELKNVPVASGEADERTDYECSIEGELVWNATHGVLHSLHWSSEGLMRVRTVRVRDGSGSDTAYEHTMNFECKGGFDAQCAVK